MTSNDHNVSAVARQFKIDGELLEATPFGSGHINDSYRAVFLQAGVPVRYMIQRINQDIFKNPSALMENIQRVTSHIATKIAGEPDCSRKTLTLVSERDGRAWHIDANGNQWRAYRFIEAARTYDAVQSTEQAFQAAKAFGRFQKLLVDLPAPRLHNTILDFHHTPKRFMALEQAIAADVAGRAILTKPEIGFAFARQSITNALLDANLPDRITHNDTKFNNVMLDDATGEGICVIDLDTVMPGLDGFDTCKKIKEIDGNIKVIICTGFVDAVDATKARNSGADDYCVKTADFEVLVNAVRKFIEMMHV